MGIRKMYRASGGAVFNKKCAQCKYLTGARLRICTYNGIEYVGENTVACGYFEQKPARRSRGALPENATPQQMSLFDVL